jgi:uncharacterized membrane protein
MKKRILAAVLASAFAVVVVASLASAAPKECSAGDPGCKTVSTTTETKDAGASPGFNDTTTETQRGNTTAPGTEPGTTTSVCTGPSGKELSPDHPPCQ